MAFPSNPSVGTEYTTTDGRKYRWTAKGKWGRANSAIPAPATQEEVAAGVVNNKYISPATFPFIRVNTTVNVPGDYATIGEALDYLTKFRIPADVIVTIQLGAGSHTAPEDCPGHPDAGQIALKGAPMLGAMPVESDFIMSVSGSDPQTTIGVNADRATTEAMLRSRFASVVTFMNGGGFKFRGGRGIGSFSQILIIGGGAATDFGISVSYGSFLVLDRVSVHDCNTGVHMYRGGQIESNAANGLTVSGCRSNGAAIYSQSAFGAPGTVFFGNVGNGLFVANNGFANIQNGACRGNMGAGMKAVLAGVIYGGGATSQRNGTNGVRAEDSATVQMNGGGARNNGSTDISAINASFITVTNPLYAGATYSPAVNQQGGAANGYAVIAN